MTIERVDGFVLSGGSAFGLDAAGGTMAYLASVGRGYEHRGARVSLVRRVPLLPCLQQAPQRSDGSRIVGVRDGFFVLT